MEQALLALLAPVAGGRRYWLKKPQNDVGSPYLILQRISSPVDYHFQGPDSLRQTRVQIDVYGDSWPAVYQAAREVTSILSGYRGGDIQGIFIDNQRDLPASDAGEVTHLYRTSIDVMVNHQEN